MKAKYNVYATQYSKELLGYANNVFQVKVIVENYDYNATFIDVVDNEKSKVYNYFEFIEKFDTVQLVVDENNNIVKQEKNEQLRVIYDELMAVMEKFKKKIEEIEGE